GRVQRVVAEVEAGRADAGHALAGARDGRVLRPALALRAALVALLIDVVVAEDDVGDADLRVRDQLAGQRRAALRECRWPEVSARLGGRGRHVDVDCEPVTEVAAADARGDAEVVEESDLAAFPRSFAGDRLGLRAQELALVRVEVVAAGGLARAAACFEV